MRLMMILKFSWKGLKMKLNLEKIRSNYDLAVKNGLQDTPANEEFKIMLEALEEAKHILDWCANGHETLEHRNDREEVREYLSKYFGAQREKLR